MRAAVMEAAARVGGSVFCQDGNPGNETEREDFTTPENHHSVKFFVFCHLIRLTATQKRCCVTPSQSGDVPAYFKLCIPRHVFSSPLIDESFM